MDLNTPLSRRDLLAGAATTGAVIAADSVLPGSVLASHMPADTVTLTFWTNHDATDVPLFQHVIRNFEAAHPTIKIKMTNETSANYDTTLISTHAVSGTLPDVFYNRTFATADRANRGWILSLDQFMQKDRMTMRNYWPAEVAQMKWQGHLYSLPYDFSDFGIYYNKTLFDKKKVKYPPADGNWTWTDLFRMGQEFIETSGGKQTMWGIDLTPLTYGWPIPGFILAWGGKWISSDLHTFEVNTPQAAQLFQTLQDAIFKTKVAPRLGAFPGGLDPFATGKVAMALNGSWATLQERSNIGKRFEWDVAPLPKGPTGKRPNSPAGGAWSIAANSKHSNEAWEWIKFLTNTQSEQILISQPTRSVPGNKLAVPMWVEVAKSGKLPPAHVQAFPSQLNDAFAVPTVPYYNEMTAITGNYVGAMLATRKPVKSSLAKWQSDVQQAIRKYQF